MAHGISFDVILTVQRLNDYPHQFLLMSRDENNTKSACVHNHSVSKS